MTLNELADIFDRSAARVELELEKDLLEFGELVADRAKEMIGHEHAIWPPLSQETIEDKASKGYSVPDPLLRTGKMRESIVAIAEKYILAVGSTDKVAAYQELGTSRIPPRPFLSTSMNESLPLAHEILGKTAVSLLTGKPK